MYAGQCFRSMTVPPGAMTETPNCGVERELDALSDVLRVAHLTGGVFLHAEFFEPWCVAAQLSPQYCEPFLGPTSHLILYHYVAEGRLSVQVQGEEPFELASGEAVMFPRNDIHLLGSQLDMPPVVASDVVVKSPKGGYIRSATAVTAPARGWSAASSGATASRAIS